jgi:hypothetical protein
VRVFPMSNDDNFDSPVDRLADLIDALDAHVRSAEGVVRRSEGNRVSILYVHAIFALLIAPAFAAIGQAGMTGPIWSVARAIPGTPGSLAFIMFAGGLILTVGATFANRRLEMLGLGFLISWYATVSISFALSIGSWLIGDHAGPRPGFYAPLVYAHFMTIMLVHCWTLRKMLRAARPKG